MVHWDLAVVVGVPGVGKTSLCRRASQSLGYDYVNYGEQMLHIAGQRDLAYNLTELFKLDMDLQHEIWKEAALRIKGKVRIEDKLSIKLSSKDELSNGDEGNVLLDLHGIDHFQVGYVLSLPIEILKPDIIVVVESSYENVLKRRRKDILEKKRDIQNFKSFNEHKEILRTSMAVCSSIVGCNFVIMENNDFDSSLSCLMEVLDK